MWPPIRQLKTVAKFLYQGYILIFKASARLLNDRGANFSSSIIDVMCKLLSMRKLWITPYHPQMNRLVERSHQTIMQMIGTLGEDKKGWLARTSGWKVHANNATQSAMMGYSHIIKCLDAGQGSQSTFTSPPLRVQRSPWEAPLPSV